MNHLLVTSACATKEPFGFAGCEFLWNIDVYKHDLNVLLTHLIRFFYTDASKTTQLWPFPAYKEYWLIPDKKQSMKLFSICSLWGCNTMDQTLPLSCESRWRCHSSDIAMERLSFLVTDHFTSISPWHQLPPTSPSCGGLGAVWTCWGSDCISHAH